MLHQHLELYKFNLIIIECSHLDISSKSMSMSVLPSQRSLNYLRNSLFVYVMKYASYYINVNILIKILKYF